MEKKEFKPYVPADKITPELTVTSVILGLLLAVVFGAANAYLGLKMGMTVSASIPAAVISMGVIRVLMRKDSVLESNIVQTIGSAGESLAAGAIFTLPVLFLWADEGIIEKPSLITLTIISLCGGLLGVFFMVPLRNALIVQEHGVLPYPEGTACAEVLLAGENGGTSAKSVFAGMGLAALIKFIVSGLKVIPETLAMPIKALKTEFSLQPFPALVGVGYICGPKIASYMLAGGVLGFFVLIPAIIIFGGETILYPGTVSISELYANGGAGAIWSNYIRYIGAGAVAAGGIMSLIKSMPLIVKTFAQAVKGMGGKKGNASLRTEKDLNMKAIIIGVVALTLIIWLVPQVPVTLVGAAIIVVFGFFFATVSSRMVGLVGSSNNPVSGMAIATLLVATLVLKATGGKNAESMMGAIAIGSIICIVAAMAGDTSQDLKTGYILGATPKKQQIGEIIGAVIAALTMGGILILFNNSYGYGTEALSAPQATLMKMIVEGVMDGNLPWGLVFIGVFIAIVIEVLGIPVLPVAIGLYLPLELSTTIMVGGILRWFVDKKKKNKDANADASGGVLFCSGLIAGEGLMGIIIAVLILCKVDTAIDLSSKLDTGIVGGLVALIVMVLLVVKFAMSGKGNKDNKEKKEVEG
ncbi:MAG: oligopeptide transporter, OPT family [Lachnospiraceae bacterium]|nr:oligopeptide transporter, OPT family [Lachnospiraceae bacterium]